MFSDVFGNLFSAWEIGFEEHEIFVEEVTERGNAESVLFHFDAESAPVGTGEEHEDRFVFFLCEFGC